MYRAVQDAKNCVRFFRNDAATTNTYKIDVNKICVGGFGSGSYVSLAYSSLDKVSEIMITKLIDFSQSPPAPYINQAISGNFDGTNTTPLNTPNYAAYSSSINAVFAIGGAVGDSSWIEPGEVPIIAMQAYRDPYAPYKNGIVIVPATGQNVIAVSGCYVAARKAQLFGNNWSFANNTFTDVYTAKANLHNDGYKGLYPFITATPGANLSCTGLNANAQLEQGSPWDWWNEPVFIASYNAYSGTTNGTAVNCNDHLDNPDMSANKGRTYLDTIQGFLNPRIVCALGLVGCQGVTGVKENFDQHNLSIYPNPVTSEINFSVFGGNTIQKVTMLDATGRVVLSVQGLNDANYKLNRNQLNSGLYFTTIELNNKSLITKKIVVE